MREEGRGLLDRHKTKAGGIVAVLILAFGRRGRRFQRHSGKHVTGLHLKRGPGKFLKSRDIYPLPNTSPCTFNPAPKYERPSGLWNGTWAQQRAPQIFNDSSTRKSLYNKQVYITRDTYHWSHVRPPAVKDFLQASVYLTGACGTPAVPLSTFLVPRCFSGCPSPSI